MSNIKNDNVNRSSEELQPKYSMITTKPKTENKENILHQLTEDETLRTVLMRALIEKIKQLENNKETQVLRDDVSNITQELKNNLNTLNNKTNEDGNKLSHIEEKLNKVINKEKFKKDVNNEVDIATKKMNETLEELDKSLKGQNNDN